MGGYFSLGGRQVAVPDGQHKVLIGISDSSTYPLPQWTSTLPVTSFKSSEQPPIEPPNDYVEASASHSSTVPVVALGGTFDHLHSGHKILLSMAAWIAHEKVIIGVTRKFHSNTLRLSKRDY